MVRNNRSIKYQVAMSLLLSFFLSYWLMSWNSKAYSAVVPVVSTLSSIKDGAVTPVRIASDRSGNMYVTDPRGGGILKYNSAGNLLQKIESASKDLLGIAVAKSGDILVSQGSVVAVYSSSGAKTAEFGTFGTANGITVDDTGAVFVVDSKNNNVQAFTANYAPVGTFGSTGSANGQFKQPSGITFEKSSGQLAVVDTLNGRVQFFTTSGVYQKTVGSFGAGPLKFTSPQAVAFEYSPDGTSLSRMYVVDSFQANVQVIDAVTTSFLRYISSYGTRGGQMVTPGDILLDPFNRLIIPNGTGTLAVFGVESATTSSGSGTTFTPPSTGSNPPALTLNPLSSVTKNSSIMLSGTVTNGSSVSVNGISANVDASGNWSLPVSLTQQGLNNFIVTASKDGSTSSISAYITLDNSVPVMTVLLFPQTGTTTSNPIQIISGSVSDVTATSVTATVNGAARAVTVNDGLFDTAIVLGIGSNIIAVTATNAAGITSQPYSCTIIYDPLAPALTVATPGGAVTGSASYTVSGTAPANSQVTVNGVPATMTATSLPKLSESSITAEVTGTQWTATIPLHTGVNQINITVSVAGNPVISTTTSSVTYAPGLPLLAITSPAADSATAKAAYVISGSASTGTTLMATMNGVSIPVHVASDGNFAVTLPKFSAPGTYVVTFTAIDSDGKMSTTSRTLFYDPAVPVLTVVDTTPSAIKVRSVGGVIIAKDKNGLITTPNNSNGTAFLDLSGAIYDQASLNIYALTPAGLSSRNGDINGDGNVDIADALLAMQISIGIVPAPTFEQLLRGDVAPLVSHNPVPDGNIRLDDAIMILQKAIGIEW
jgi:hypothetical protein